MRFVVLAAVMVAMSGCVTTRQFSGPSGETGYLTKCNGGARSMADCYDEAAKVCKGKGYNILAGTDKSCGAVVSGNMVMDAQCRELTYTCKP